MRTYPLSIITPNGKVFGGEVEGCVAPGSEGSFGILAQHAPLVTSLNAGILTVKQNTQEIYFAISSGICEVNGRGEVLILLDGAMRATDRNDARTKLKQFQEDQAQANSILQPTH